jgi:hypothetical protein
MPRFVHVAGGAPASTMAMGGGADDEPEEGGVDGGAVSEPALPPELPAVGAAPGAPAPPLEAELPGPDPAVEPAACGATAPPHAEVTSTATKVNGP